MIKFEELFASLNRKKVRYLLTGGIAVNLFGIERATADIDIVIDLDQKNLMRFVEAAEGLGLRPKIPVKLDDLLIPEKREEWSGKKNMVVFSMYDPVNPFFLVDIFIKEPFNFNDVYNRRVKMKSGRVAIPVIPIDDLIAMKKKTARPQDKADVHYLRKILKELKDEN